MFGPVYVSTLRVSDSGLLNMSGLNTYLSTLFREFNMRINDAYNQFPALYGDVLFPQFATIIARYSTSHSDDSRINLRMSSVRESIEHLFALHIQTFKLFSTAHRFHILLGGVQVVRLVFNSFLLLNCYTCMNQSPSNCTIRLPTLEEYLPFDQVLRQAPDTTDDLLQDMYNYNL